MSDVTPQPRDRQRRPTATLYARLPAALYAALCDYADQRGLTITAAANLTITAGLDTLTRPRPPATTEGDAY